VDSLLYNVYFQLSEKERIMAPNHKGKLLGELLIDAGLIDESQLFEALDLQEKLGQRLARILIDQGAFTVDDFVEFLANVGLPSVDLQAYDVDPEVVNTIPREYALEHEVFPLDRLGRLLTVGMTCPLDQPALNDLERITGLDVKPVLCSPEDIREAIGRYYEKPEDADTKSDGLVVPGGAKSLKLPLRLEGIASLIRNIDYLPTLPETVRRISALCMKPDGDIKELARLVEGDPALAAKVLSLVNSSVYSFDTKILDIQQAVSLLGMAETLNIAQGVECLKVIGAWPPRAHSSFVEHASRSANLTALAAQIAGLDERRGYYAAGLLHDIGQVVLRYVSPSQCASIPSGLSGDDLLQAETDALGITHTEAGFLLAKHWDLPSSITYAIRYHHEPNEAEDYRSVVACVAVADSLSRVNAIIANDCAASLSILKSDASLIDNLLSRFIGSASSVSSEDV
jgi:HD-like signal output (HDOD) protein